MTGHFLVLYMLIVPISVMYIIFSSMSFFLFFSVLVFVSEIVPGLKVQDRCVLADLDCFQWSMICLALYEWDHLCSLI